jgi:hypothetical protein
MSTSTAISKIDNAILNIEEIIKTCNVTALVEKPALQQAVVLATGISQLRTALTEEVMNAVFMPLQSSPLGFCTDRDVLTKDQKSKMNPQEIERWTPGYRVVVVRDCLIQSMIHGLRPVGNEWNIISKRMYAAKNGMGRLVSEFPGLTDLSIVPNAPQLSGDKSEARVGVTARWLLNGKPMSLVRDMQKTSDGLVVDTRFAIRVNYGMGSDAIIGKSIRKTYKSILDLLTGSTLTIPDGDVIDTVGTEMAEPAPAPAPPEHDGRRMKIGNNSGPRREQQPAAPPDPEDDGR